jgi:hypothetical protein
VILTHITCSSFCISSPTQRQCSRFRFSFPRFFNFIMHFSETDVSLGFCSSFVFMWHSPLFRHPPHIPFLLSLSPTRASIRARLEPVLPRAQNGLSSERHLCFLRLPVTYLCHWCTSVLPSSRLCNDHNLQRNPSSCCDNEPQSGTMRCTLTASSTA